MLKKDLLVFIEKVEKKAIHSVNEKFHKEINSKEEEILSKYDTRIKALQKAFNNFSVGLNELMADMKEDKETAFHGDYMINCGLRDLSRIKERIIISCDFMGEVQKIKDIQHKELSCVKENYSKVYAVAKSMSSAKKIASYLKELGFDISSVENKDITTLVANIDKSKLFVCGENK